MQIGRVQANRYLAFTGFTICFLFLLASSPSHCLGEGRGVQRSGREAQGGRGDAGDGTRILLTSERARL
jgi:hypothetical protein